MSKMIKIIDIVVLAGIFLFVAFVIGFCVGKKGAAEQMQSIVKEEPEILIPTMVEKREISADEVKAKLLTAQSFAVFEREYQVSKEIVQTKYWWEETVSLTGKGIVEIGYDMAEAQVMMDGNTAVITLPKPKLISNQIIWEEEFGSQMNQVMNQEIVLEEIKAEGLLQAETNGIYESADAKTKVLIEKFLAEFVDLDVEFMVENI